MSVGHRGFLPLSEKALALLRHYPRINLNNLAKLPNDRPKDNKRRLRGRKYGFKHGENDSTGRARQLMPMLGYRRDINPIYMSTPRDLTYNYGHQHQRQYPPVSLKTLQLLIDTGRLDPSKPIDLAALCLTHVYNIDPRNKSHFGVNLTAEGADCFDAKLNLEVQWTCEEAIAAIESKGGVITSSYFDILSVRALADPEKFFKSGQPIPKRLIPPANAMGYYIDPAKRGYLADPKLIAEDRLVLAQKYGYELHDIESDPDKDMLMAVKDPRQVFYGLQPGWVVSLKDKAIFKPEEAELKKFYDST